MSFNLVAASSQYLEHAAAIVTAYPVTFACWFHPVAATVNYALMSIGDNVLLSRLQLLTNTAGGVQAASNDGSGTNSATTTTTFTAGSWHHAAAVFASATSRASYLNGGGKGTNTTSRVPAGLNTTNLGTRYAASVRGQFLNGRIAEAAMWNVALSDAEIATLGAGFQPTLVRPGSLVAYWPCIGNYSPAIDLARGRNLTVTGATKADHCRINYRRSGFTVSPSAPAGTLPILGTLTATPGVWQVTLSQAVTHVGDLWGLLVARSQSTGFTPQRIDTVGIAEYTAAPIVLVDRPVAPGTYYYRASAFTLAGAQTAWTSEAQAIVP